MITLSGSELLIPAIVTLLIIVVRQFTERLDGPVAYWVSVIINILAQVTAELATGAGGGAGGLMSAAVIGAGGGMVASPGLAITGKRLGLKKIVKPREAAG